MNTKILAGLGLAAMLAGPAAAADLAYPAPAQTYAVAVPFSWTGFYLGGNVGYGWGKADASPDIDGFIGGLQAGYNYQVGSFVIGAETDIQYSNVSSSVFNLDYFGTIRARAGVAMDQFLVYGTGGFAYGRGSYEFAGLTNSQTNTGWTLGVGAEYAITPNWTARLEYSYLDLGTDTYATVNGPLEVGLTTNLVRLGANYKF